MSGVKSEAASKRAALVSACDALSAPTGWTWCMQTLPSGLTASVSLCNPWPTFPPVDVTPLHMPPALHALKLLGISWARRKNNFCCQSVNTGVKESLLLLDVVKAVSAAATPPPPPLSPVGNSSETGWFCCESCLFFTLNVIYNNEIAHFRCLLCPSYFHLSLFIPHRQHLDYCQRSFMHYNVLYSSCVG